MSILVTRITAMTLPAGCSALATPVACFRAAADQLHVADACCVAISIDGTDRQTDGRTDRRTPYHYVAAEKSTTLLLLIRSFNGLFSRTTLVSQYQRGKQVWI